MVLKCSSLNKDSAIFMAKNRQSCEDKILDPQNPFCINDQTNLYIQNIGHIWAYIHADYQYFKKS